MSDVISDGLASLRDHMPSVSTAKDAVSSVQDARYAVLDHLPSRDDLDVTAITDRLPGRKPGKRGLTAVVFGLAAVVGALAMWRRKRDASPQPVPPSIYTPPLPKP